jgi:two-component sensor histidine kinase
MGTLAQAAPGNVLGWLDTIARIPDETNVVRVDREDLWALLDKLPVALLISTDTECSRMIGNQAAQALLREPLGSNLSQTAPVAEAPAFQVFAEGELIPTDDLPMQKTARTGQPISGSECEIRFKDGSSTVFISGHCIPLHDEAGQVCGSLGAFIDVTEQHTAHEKNSLLAREMAHRVKNTVALAQALAHGTIRRKLDPATYEMFQQRLMNLGQAQDLIASSRWSALSLRDLLTSTLVSLAQAKISQVEVSGPDVEVGADLAQSLSMVFHELMTNACKYGALKDDGRLVISWSTQEDVVTVVWREHNLSEVTPGKPGFGSEMAKRIFRALPRGKFTRTYAPTGVTVTLQFAT